MTAGSGEDSLNPPGVLGDLHPTKVYLL